jgi:hypothetical protein
VSEDRYINPWSQFVGCFLPNWLLERPELSLGAKVTYARLAQFAGRRGVAIVRRHVLAAKLASSERSVGTYLTELADNGLIESNRPGLGKPNRYRFLRHSWMQFRADHDEPDIPDRQDLPIQSGKDRQSRTARFADQDQQNLPLIPNEENLKRERGAHAPDAPPENPSLFTADDLPHGSPGNHGSSTPPAPPPPAASQNGQKPRAAETTEIVRRVFEAWQRATGHPGAKLTDARRQKVTARLREGYTAEEILLAVTEGWRRDPWPERADNNDLVILLRTGPQLEKFLNLARKASGSGAHALDPEEELRRAREEADQAEARLQAARFPSLNQGQGATP